MKNKDRSLLPGELKDCVVHCGFCKKRNLFQDFTKEQRLGDPYKCPSCGRYIKRLYVSKEEKLINEPIMEKNRNNFIHRWKTDSEFRKRFRCFHIKE